MAVFRGVRTRVLLIAALIAVIVTVTGGSLLIVRDRVRRQVAQDLSADLTHSLSTFQNIQRQRRDVLIRENELLADLPSLKALMTTGDKRTIADGAIDLWKVSGSDLFALVDAYGRVLIVYTKGRPPSETLVEALQQTMTRPQEHYLTADGRLFDFSMRPLYFGGEAQGTLLGYVISGYQIDRNVIGLIGHASGDDAAFLAGPNIVASTLSPELQQELLLKFPSLLSTVSGRNAEVVLGGDHYLGTGADLSGEAEGQLRLVVLKSFAQANRSIREINRLVLLLGAAALVLGTLLMITLSRIVTEPLELLAQGVRAFGFGNPSHGLPDNGTREVRELSTAFARMRGEIIMTNRALLDSERLATIGSMASSVSHDLRHYLAAVYANAEFLSSARLSQEERVELFEDIQLAVHGATELLDSLLIFSKTGVAFHRERDSLLRIAEKAVSLLKAHPEAEGVSIKMECDDPSGGYALVDPKQMQRAIYNLLLNACQSTHRTPPPREVSLVISNAGDTVSVTITDSGPGVAEHIRNSLFEPFVSEGKQSGTGLGLTLAHAVAKEHGGTVTLVSTRPGETVFQLSLQFNFSGVGATTPS
ncbi:periplasmic sensor signal transduction histidine kinase [Acidisarcina polymorpha]|uniref:histidine kinase n=1 Tax=Acidisarcina polymorpha TaxID=2211140 RepID=A0A2Z5FU65_9BACT|nr:HAMP domain-containing sensor histidine kinase [Acidisarcina polymorpha]AXC10350.1 periplasmic sensor signal transduction histidine kinase [Acidisarcina polymorpha]